MIFLAKIDPTTGQLVQGMGFSTPGGADAHIAAHPNYDYVTCASFVSPRTHQYIDGQIVPKPEE